MLLHQCQYLVPFAWKVRLGSILHYSRERVLALLSHTLSPRQIPLMFFLELAKSLLSHCIYISNLTFPTFTCTPFSFIFPFFSSLFDTRYNYFKIKDHFSQSLQPYINFFFSFLPVSFCDPALIISVFSISIPGLFIQDWEENIIATLLASIPDGSYKRRKHLFVAYR